MAVLPEEALSYVIFRAVKPKFPPDPSAKRTMALVVVPSHVAPAFVTVNVPSVELNLAVGTLPFLFSFFLKVYSTLVIVIPSLGVMVNVPFA